MMDENAIRINNLSFSYGENQILKNVNTQFPKDKFSVLLGTNGCGKSTLLKILASLENRYKGQIHFFNQEKEKLKARQKAATIGFLNQDFQSTFDLSVKDILLTGRSAFSRFNFSKEDVQQVQDIAKKLDLIPLLEIPFNTLSGGQKQRVLIGRILVQNPKIILLDEPTNHLDIYHKHQLLIYLKRLATEGFTIIAVMHDPTLAFQYADHIYFMYDQSVLKGSGNYNEDLDYLKKVFDIEFIKFNHNHQPFIISKPI